MNRKTSDKKQKTFQPKITISGPGVLHIESSELVKTAEAQKQIKALGKLRKKEGFIVSGEPVNNSV